MNSAADERLMPAPVPSALGGPVGGALLRHEPEDFQVTERLGFEPDGEGPHRLVLVRKRCLSTPEAAARLAEAAGVARRDVGHAGLKDRRAVAVQWLSCPAGAALEPGPLGEGLEILRLAPHRRKLKPGSLRGNHFELLLREVSGARRALSRRLLDIARRGVPNAFGPQRFGRGGANLDKAAAWFAGRLRVRERGLQGLLISAARAEQFNRVLASRIRDGSWDQAGRDDLMVLDGRGSLFPAADETPERLARRLAWHAVHPTGPLAGTGGARPGPEVAALEAAAAADLHELQAALEQRRVTAGRRALRLSVGGLWWRWEGADGLRLGFELPAGSYATVVLAELVEVVD